MPNLVLLGQTVRSSAGTIGPSRPVFQGHWRSSEMTWIDTHTDRSGTSDIPISDPQ